jgi:TetR/AcrR family transcriptional regulator, regulator of cefoperazone and chloramphenicol sensitivity
MMPAHALARPVPEPPLGTRERLLEAAERLFAARGFRATSVRALTAEARCNVASVNYYFGGKEGLYREMFRRRLVALREQRIAGIRRAMNEAGGQASLEVTLQAFTTAFLEPHLDQSGGRRLMRLFSRELLDPHLRPGMLRREMVEPVRRALTEALQTACPGLDARAARRCVHSVIAQLAHVVQMRNAPGAVRDRELRDFTLTAAVDHIVHFSAAGIRACLS